MIQGGRRGVGFGVGQEPLPALFASFGAEVLATDQSYEDAQRAGWVKSSQHSRNLLRLNERSICTDEMFHQLVQFAEVDMNGLPAHMAGRFDFCWSSCALEHLGSLKHGTKFIKGSLDLLRPGGIAVHTTEFNLSSDERTIESEGLSVYRRRDIEELVQEIEAEGHTVEPIDWTHGNGLAETVVDLPPWGRGEPHVRLLLGDFECTSIGLIFRRKVEDIVTRELDRRIEEIVPQEFRRRPDYLERRFTEVYEKALWGDDETRSGWGSKRNSGHVQTALEILRMVIPKYNILSIADIPCGDFNWQLLFLNDHAQVSYIGYDIVGSMIVDNKRKNPSRKFTQLDITKEVPAKADLILCKDMLNHLTYADIRRAIGNMKRSGSTYLLASNDFTWPENVDVVDEGSNDRPVDVLRAPLSYPSPLWNNHYMGLWLLAEM
ncbi:MAG TPA: methyltransferase domain-containing protein [Chthoniobacterales bacterium]|jgi:2-polyprenyl-3-methyl-5-hydroxy-6-metoxy-1,4-benzoquinol methylase